MRSCFTNTNLLTHRVVSLHHTHSVFPFLGLRISHPEPWFSFSSLCLCTVSVFIEVQGS